jgi:hypothetical protein
MVWVLICAVASSCKTTIQPDVGVWHHNFSTSDGDAICLNYTVYPAFVIFIDHAPDTFYTEYFSQTNSSNLQTLFSSEVRFLDGFRVVRAPFSASEIITKTGCDLSFTTAVLPGLCADGVLFSNLPRDYLHFSRSATSFYRLQTSTDKCVLFSAHGVQSFHLVLNSSLTAQVIVYPNFTSPFALFGNDERSFASENDLQGVAVRIVTEDDLPTVEIDMMSTSDQPRFPRRQFSQNMDAPLCRLKPTWATERVAVALIIVTSVLAVITIVLCSIECYAQGESAGNVRVHWLPLPRLAPFADPVRTTGGRPDIL